MATINNSVPTTFAPFAAGLEEFCGSKFWDQSLTFNTSSPDLTQCFLHTFSVWIPCIFLWLFTPFQLYTIFKSKKSPHPWTLLNVAKLVVGLLLVVDTWAVFFRAVRQSDLGEDVSPVWFVYPLILGISLLNAFFLIFMCQRKGVSTSGVLFLTWLLFAVLGVTEFRWWFLENRLQEDLFRFVAYMVYYPLIWIQLILSAFADSPSTYGDEKEDRPCPEFRSSFLNQITFWWFTSLAIKGWKNPLETKDLWNLNPKDKAETLVPKWEKEWEPAMDDYWRRKALMDDANQTIILHHRTSEEEVNIVSPKKQKNKGPQLKQTAPPSILWTLFKVCKGTFVPGVVFKFTYDIMQFANPLILKLLIGFVEEPNAPLWQGFFYTFLLFVVSLTASLILHQYFHRMFTLGMHSRGILISAVFNKALRLSNAARKGTTVGEIVNLMSVDSQRFQDMASYVTMLFSAPLQIFLSIYFLWQILGPPVLAALAVMIFLMPVNFVMMSRMRKWSIEQMKYKDDRIKLMNEVLSGIKVLKLYAWEESFKQMLLDIREKELKVLRKTAILNAVTSFTWMCAPFLVAAATFGTYVLTDPEKHILTPQRAFVSLSLLNILRFPMTMLPGIISAGVMLAVSNRRLKTFFVSEELDPHMVDKNPKKQKEAIVMKNGEFAWDKRVDAVAEGTNNGIGAEEEGSKGPTLRNVNLEIKKGDLVAVVGLVGSGKSSLLSAMLGEMDKIEGYVGMKGSVSYVPQQAWIQNMTLKDNIVFGKEYNPAFYDQVVDACALRTDFDILPGGDSTEIGEKGINLSGGQKQRVSLARSVYSKSDIYLLDDPLSAVDSHVGKHIFDKVLGKEGILQGKTRILVTHGLSFLKHADKIIVLHHGEISEMGTYKDLISRKGAFAEFLEEHLVEEAVAHHVTIDDEEGDTPTELDEILCDLEKCDPGSRRRLTSQISVISAAGSTPPTTPTLSKSPSPQRLLREKSTSPSNYDGAERLNRMISQQVVKGILEEATGKKKIANGVEEGTTDEKTKLVQEEVSQTGQVKLKVYLLYLRSIGYLFTFGFIFLYLLGSAFSVGTNVWLADWSDDASGIATENATQEVIAIDVRLGIYVTLGMGQGISVFFASLFMLFGMVMASREMHKGLLDNLVRSPMAFFDVTPLGRIINRCGKDVDVVDNMLPQNIRAWLMCMVSVIATLMVIIFATPIFAVVVLPLGILYYFVLKFYVNTSRQLKRLESVSRSPIYSHFQETIQGASSIRAYGAEGHFKRESERLLNNNFITYYPNITSNRWLAVRLEFVGNIIVMFAALFAVLGKHTDAVTAGLVGLSISYALQITQSLNWAVRMTSDLETNIVAVERIKEYSETETEAAWESEVSNRPPKEWPETGKVEFDGYATRYRPGLDLVVKGVSAQISPRQKVGIVGRTGAGKSSLTLALFRIIEPAGGRIVIDGRDIARMGLHELRSKITIIPQDPVLFSGTLRINLDPFGRHSDAELWTCLEHSHLKVFVSSQPEKLQYSITEGGENLSVGQRQLVCLARALLRKTRVLVLDEATAAVDVETDQLIQNTIRKEFSQSTILTIAHRLNTILDYDRIMVMDSGELKEFDPPQKLLNNKKTIFYGMAKDAGLVS